MDQDYHVHKYGKKRKNPKLKKCSRCRRFKAAKNFYADNHTTDKLTCRCISCTKEVNRENYLKRTAGKRRIPKENRAALDGERNF